MVDFLPSPIRAGGTRTAGFGEAGPNWTNTHTGVDFAAPTLTPIVALADGTVTYSDWFSDAYGNMVQIDHGNGIETWYGHMLRTARSVGTTVRQGQIIGFVGTSGNTTGPHVHVEFRVDGMPQDPDRYLGGSAGGGGSASGGVAGPSTSEDDLRSGAVRGGYFAGGLLLLVISAVAARRMGIV